VGNLCLTACALVERAGELFREIDAYSDVDRVEIVNEIRRRLHRHSPFRAEPVDLVLWLPLAAVEANDYNPNAVAPPEMRLLRHSIESDGYTQPIVAWNDEERYEVVDGFHRHRVGREVKPVRDRLLGHLPVVSINEDRRDRSDRIAATIRHNRARGRHRVEAMTEIVVELARRNWSDARIGRELGMDPDEVLRLKQISGLAELFAEREFSDAQEETA
jgi:ParB-like chromosome segregation protein Spo0J